MKTDTLVYAGKILKSHGFEGAVVVRAEIRLNEHIKIDEPVFLEIEGKPVPFFPQWVEGAGSTVIVKFDGYDTTPIMAEFIGCRLFIPAVAVNDKQEDYSPNYLTGFTLISTDKSVKGVVKGNIDTGAQILLEVDFDGREILVPLHEELIVSIDPDTKEIVMDLPEGLADINS